MGIYIQVSMFILFPMIYIKKLHLLCFCIIFSILTAFGQVETTPNQFIGLNIGRSIHGTGDMRGIAYHTVYSKRFRKKLSWTATFGGTLHDGSVELFFPDSDRGGEVDGSIRYTTGGIQSTFGVRYGILQTSKNEIYVGLHALVRYQSTSYYDDVKIIYPIVTGLPIPVISFINNTPARTFAIGGSTRLGYNYTTDKNLLFGILGEFQMDSNGDVLSQLGLIVGKRF